MFARQAKAIADVRWSVGCDETYDWFPGNVESVAGLRCLHVAVSFSFGHFPQGSLICESPTQNIAPQFSSERNFFKFTFGTARSSLAINR